MPDSLFSVLRRDDQRLTFLLLLPQICRVEFVHRLHGSSSHSRSEGGRKRPHNVGHKLQKLDATFTVQNVARESGKSCSEHAGEVVASTSFLLEDSSCVSEWAFNRPQGEGGNANADNEGVVDTSYIPGLDDSVALRCLAYCPETQHGCLAMLSRRHRDLIHSALLLRLRKEYQIVDPWICIFTDSVSGWSAFEPKMSKWRNLARANVPESFLSSDKESLAAGTHLLWLGMEGFDFACYRYDMDLNRWETGPQMVNNRSLFGSATCGKFAFVAGGFSAGGMQLHLLNSAEMYDSSRGIWEPIPSMSTARHKCAGFFMDGKFYVIGGKTRDHVPITSGEEYDPERRVWRTIQNMYPAPAANSSIEPSPPLVAVAGNQLYAIESSSNLLKSYNKHTNRWRVLGPVPVRTDHFNGWGLAFKGLGDRLFVIGRYQGGAGVAVYSWRPQAGVADPVWELVNLRVQGTGNFLYNCAVAAC